MIKYVHKKCDLKLQKDLKFLVFVILASKLTAGFPSGINESANSKEHLLIGIAGVPLLDDDP